MDVSITALNDEDGAVGAYFVQLIDVTESLEAEAALRASERSLADAVNLYRTVFEHTTDGFLLAELLLDDAGEPVDLVVLRTNRVIDDVLGVQADRLWGRRLDGFPINLGPEWLSFLADVVRSGQGGHHRDFFVPELNRWFDAHGFPYSDTIAGVLLRDVTETHETEERLASLADALEASHDAIMLLDREDRIAYVNNALVGTLGWDRSEIIGRPASFFVDGYVSPDSAAAAGLQPGYEHGPGSRGHARRVQLEATDRTGAEKTVDIKQSPLFGDGGQYKGAIVTIRDITTTVQHIAALRAEEARAQALVEDLRRADEAKDAFLAALSHELRNPLASIAAAIDIMREAPAGERRRALDLAGRQAQHLTRLVEDLLDITRLASNKLVLRRQPQDLAALVERAADDIRFRFREKGVHLTVEVPEEPLPADVDGVRITQVLQNLLHNAAKFTDRGCSAALRLHRDLDSGDAVISVSDDGEGIAPEALDRVFDPFFQAAQSLDRTQGGLGLGLGIVKQVVDLHGGHVSASSPGIGRGAAFTIRLPALAAETALVPAPTPAAETGDRRLRILLVEDDPTLLELTGLQLNLWGYEVRSAQDGEAGLALAVASVPDVVLCDVGLPGMDGFEVARRLRLEPALDHVPLVALTGYGRPSDVEQSRQAGFDRHLTKPVDANLLRLTLRELSPQG